MPAAERTRPSISLVFIIAPSYPLGYCQSRGTRALTVSTYFLRRALRRTISIRIPLIVMRLA